MKFLTDYSNIFRRYDLVIEKVGKARTVSTDSALQKVAACVVDGDDEGMVAAANSALASKDPMAIINDGLIAGMGEVTRLWDEGIYFLPQVILAADAMNIGIALCEKKNG